MWPHSWRNLRSYGWKYELAGYRERWEEYQRELRRYGDDPNWKAYLDDKKDYLDKSAKLWGLSEDEKTEPRKHIEYWPIPSKVLKGKLVREDKRRFLAEVYSWRYGQSSAVSHVAWFGMAMGLFATMPECHWYPDMLESDAVYVGLLFLLMILSEIEASCNYGHKQDLRYIWTILNSYSGESADYYHLRYDSLLGERD